MSSSLVPNTKHISQCVKTTNKISLLSQTLHNYSEQTLRKLFREEILKTSSISVVPFALHNLDSSFLSRKIFFSFLKERNLLLLEGCTAKPRLNEKDATRRQVLLTDRGLVFEKIITTPHSCYPYLIVSDNQKELSSPSSLAEREKFVCHGTMGEWQHIARLF